MSTKSEAIAKLQSLPDDAVIVLAYWDREDYFPKVPIEEWKWVAEYLESKMDWSQTHDQMTFMVEDKI